MTDPAKVRGAMVLNAVQYVKDTYGRAAHERLLRALPARHCGTFLGPLREASWEPAADLVAYMEAAQRTLAGGDPGFHAALGAYSGRIERRTQGYQPMVADPSTAMRLGPKIWGSFYDTGRLEVDIRGPREAIARVHDFAVSRVLCERTCGAWEGLLSSDALPAHVTETACVHDGAAWCEFRVLWR